MFERFTATARRVVIDAQAEARDLQHDHIGTEHLLLALLAGGPGPAQRALADAGLTYEDVRVDLAALVGTHFDEDALRTVGVELDQIRRRIEAEFGPGALNQPAGSGPRRRRDHPPKHLPFSADAKEVLEQTLREALALGHRELTDSHLLLGLLRCAGALTRHLLERHRVSVPALRARVLDQLGATA